MISLVTFFMSRNPLVRYIAAALLLPELVFWVALYSFLALFLGVAPAVVVIVVLVFGAGYAAWKEN